MQLVFSRLKFEMRDIIAEKSNRMDILELQVAQLSAQLTQLEYQNASSFCYLILFPCSFNSFYYFPYTEDSNGKRCPTAFKWKNNC